MHTLRDTSEGTLVAQAQRGDSTATAELLRRNIGLIVRTAKRYALRGLAIEDIISEGQIGFLEGLARFDPDRGTKLSTYAMHWVLHYIRHYVRRESNVLGSSARTYKKANQIMQYIERTYNPDMPAVRERFSISEERLLALMALICSGSAAERDVEFLPSTAYNPEADAIATEGSRRTRALLWRALAKLTPRERSTIAARFADDPGSLAAIGAEFGVSRERARQYQNRALAKLRKALRAAGVEWMADL